MAYNVVNEIEAKIEAAQARYGPFASTHEAMGVALEEWDELRAAVHANSVLAARQECIDLAAVLIRLARDIDSSEQLRNRSIK